MKDVWGYANREGGATIFIRQSVFGLVKETSTSFIGYAQVFTMDSLCSLAMIYCRNYINKVLCISSIKGSH